MESQGIPRRCAPAGVQILREMPPSVECWRISHRVLPPDLTPEQVGEEWVKYVADSDGFDLDAWVRSEKEQSQYFARLTYRSVPQDPRAKYWEESVLMRSTPEARASFVHSLLEHPGDSELVATFEDAGYGFRLDENSGKVLEVVPGMQADALGVRKGMWVISVGGQQLSMSESMSLDVDSVSSSEDELPAQPITRAKFTRAVLTRHMERPCTVVFGKLAGVSVLATARHGIGTELLDGIPPPPPASSVRAIPRPLAQAAALVQPATLRALLEFGAVEGVTEARAAAQLRLEEAQTELDMLYAPGGALAAAVAADFVAVAAAAEAKEEKPSAAISSRAFEASCMPRMLGLAC
eukprot:SAG11_NODE_1824_length_4204_cov_8.667235_3_plen_352_part_00